MEWDIPRCSSSSSLCQGWALRSFPHRSWGGVGRFGCLLPCLAALQGHAESVRWKSHLVLYQGFGSCKASLSLPVPGALAGGDGITPSLAQGCAVSSCSPHTHRDHAGLLKHHLLQWSLPG